MLNFKPETKTFNNSNRGKAINTVTEAFKLLLVFGNRGGLFELEQNLLVVVIS